MIRVGDAARAPEFPDAAKIALANAQLRRNVRHATDVIRGKRALVVGEMSDWQQLREAGRQIKAHVLQHLDTYLQQFEENCTRAGGHVHWAADADEANRIIVDLIKARGESEVIKVKTMTSDETRLNVALEAAGIAPYETDLADLIIQLGKRSAVAHRRAGAAPQPGRDPRHLPAPHAARGARRRARGPDVGGPEFPQGEVPPRPGRIQRRQLSGR
jgi:hypothetical protein